MLSRNDGSREMKKFVVLTISASMLVLLSNMALAADPPPVRPTPLTPSPTLRLPPGQVPTKPIAPGPTLPPDVLKVPVISEFRAVVPDCQLPDPKRAILSYRVAAVPGGPKIQRVTINGVYFD